MDKDVKKLLDKVKNAGVIKLNLGVGNRPKEGFLGIDVNDGPHTDILCDLVDGGAQSLAFRVLSEQ